MPNSERPVFHEFYPPTGGHDLEELDELWALNQVAELRYSNPSHLAHFKASDDSIESHFHIRRDGLIEKRYTTKKKG